MFSASGHDVLTPLCAEALGGGIGDVAIPCPSSVYRKLSYDAFDKVLRLADTRSCITATCHRPVSCGAGLYEPQLVSADDSLSLTQAAPCA